ncbi:MAG TPA: SAM-dependent methyltransferase, partial [Chloroflexia bacterium]|nr:SAM-dependent methyltransferase [Chloroflexia bacterium]
MDQYLQANRDLWNAWTELHERSEMYDVEGFKKGNFRLHPIEKQELGDVRGKTMLHLQCHFGLDTLSWANLGATVTGADFSEKA